MEEQSAMSQAVRKPDHVADAVFYDFDMFRDPGLRASPHERLLELIRDAPKIFWTPRNGGHWVFLGHNIVADAARDTDSFSNETIPREQLEAMLALLPEGSPHVPVPYPLMLDPPQHQKYRQPLLRVFSPKTVTGLQDSIRSLACALIDKIVGEGRCEFMSAVAEPLPVQIFLKMFGLPLEMMPDYRALVKENFAQQGNSSQAEGMLRLMKVAAIMRKEVLARRDHPRDDIISLLWSLEIDGKPTTLEDIENYAVLLFIAGLDTVVNSMGYAACHLAKDQELQTRIRAQPGLIPQAVEEMLRRYSFVVVPRRVKKDLVFMGLEMKRDDRVELHLPAANLDPDAFAGAATYQLNRKSHVHIAFNAGPHRCLGSHLARVELQIFYEVLLARIPQFRLDPARPPSYLCSQILGIDKLHLIWDRH
jgi:cytochrome P450